eukprot:719059-Karenia_brevis.AAC.1
MLFGVLARGVSQGCPCSGFLYALVVDCSFWLVTQKFIIPQKGVAGGCADDMAFVIDHINDLPMSILQDM